MIFHEINSIELIKGQKFIDIFSHDFLTNYVFDRFRKDFVLRKATAHRKLILRY